MALGNIVVCSFYTADDYYRSHADQLRQNLEQLGVAHELSEIVKAEGEEWPDICRKKIPFLAGVCARNPDKKVFWIDVDCQLNDLPSMVAGFSADLIGFQRGFGSPLGIGYERRTRFWEPCFFGINTTEPARKFITDAESLEARAEIRATDDYFFEEAWRANAPRMSFQVIPSTCVESRASTTEVGHEAFFTFGASGNVAHYQGKVQQHGRLSSGRTIVSTTKIFVRRSGRAVLRTAKAAEQRMPAGAALRLRSVADSLGIIELISPSGPAALQIAGAPVGASPHRRQLVSHMLTSGQAGDLGELEEVFSRLQASQIPSTEELAAKQAAEAFAAYATRPSELPPVPLMWWPRPFPGNFGDWLSPLVVGGLSGRAVTFVSPTARSTPRHLVGIGSIGKFIRSNSITVGTGISSPDFEFERTARFVSVRGPLTAEHLSSCGGPRVESFGDPGLLVSRVIPLERSVTNGKLALVRHTTHTRISLKLPDDVDELSVVVADPASIEAFLAKLIEYDGVVTSAMHVMIACHSYGIPCALIGFKGFEATVHGTGIKYEDYCRGADLGETYRPAHLGRDLRREGLRGRLHTETVSAEKLDEIAAAFEMGFDLYDKSTDRVASVS